ncbi:transketolase [Undibacterium sp. Xuan67W]|uniref:transketolase n=1 Tax=Undibacterium sp. Xuan67W TaxID=3413057 RepID=UPI003BF00A48
MQDAPDLDQLCINTLRTLSMDAVQKAQSGHPGTPMGSAPTVYCLWQEFLRFDPVDASWPNRDRFVLSAGHACALLYSLIYLSGIKAQGYAYPVGDHLAVTMDDLMNFRQAGSHCTGHPEHGWTTGVETTTGPLGQGLATSVGMAMAERWLAATYNRPELPLFDHNTYALCGDGDMMEGVSSEAASLAGHLQLSHLCWIYDSNHISIEGSTELSFTENVAARFIAYGWHVICVDDVNDTMSLRAAYQEFLDTDHKPTLMITHSHIGYGAPHKQDTREAHGEPLGEEELRLAKQFFGCDPDKNFDVPRGVVAHFAAQFGKRGKQAHTVWINLFNSYQQQYPDLAIQIHEMLERSLPNGWDDDLSVFPADAKGLSTRDASGKVLNQIAQHVPWLLGGAADLAPSTKTELQFEFAGEFQAPSSESIEPSETSSSYLGRNIHFGVREHAMVAIGNGLSLSGPRPYVASFLVFSDYCRAALWLSAMMELPLIAIFTHDSISMGEDGPTHQPVEHLASLRAMPGMLVLRPADANEVTEAWRVIMQSKNKAVCLILSRQALPVLDRTIYASAAGIARGAYILAGSEDIPDVILLATGSEIALCVTAYEQLCAEGIKARVVSMPSWELFESQDAAYRDQILPPHVLARVSVEQASMFGWERYTGSFGSMLGMHSFGLSAPGTVVSHFFGFEASHIVNAAKTQIAKHLASKATSESTTVQTTQTNTP